MLGLSVPANSSFLTLSLSLSSLSLSLSLSVFLSLSLSFYFSLSLFISLPLLFCSCCLVPDRCVCSGEPHLRDGRLRRHQPAQLGRALRGRDGHLELCGIHEASAECAGRHHSSRPHLRAGWVSSTQNVLSCWQHVQWEIGHLKLFAKGQCQLCHRYTTP